MTTDDSSSTSASKPEQLLIGDVFRRNARVIAGQVAASLGDLALTHGELDRLGNRMARSLASLGVRKGDRVVSWADTCLEVLPVFVALAKLGAVFAPLNARLGVDEAKEIVEMARPRMLLSDALHSEAAAELADRIGLERVGRFNGEGPGADLRVPALDPDDRDIPTPSDLVETDPHVIFFTSGSTGRPKGVTLSHRANYLRSFQGVFRDEPERSVCMFPLFHMAAFTLALSAWQTRGEIAFVHNATAEEILDAVAARRANRLYCIPAIWRRILDCDLEKWDTSSLAELDTGTSATPIELLEALRERFPKPRIRIYYGCTEVGSATTLPDADVFDKPGSVGPASPGVDLRLTETGEICVRSAYMTDGYFDNPEATQAALHDGWFHTGDLGALDADGYLSIVGRLKELIRTGGESVAPTEIEAALVDHPAIDELTVVGLPDMEWGEVVCAAVVLKSGATITLEELQAYGDERLAGFKKPRRLALMDSLPRTAATGQVQRTLLVERIQAQSEPASVTRR